MTNLVLTYTIEKEQCLREFLLENNISRKTLTRIKFDNDGSIKVNDKEENVRYILKNGDKVTITLPSEKFSEHVRFIEGNLDIIYEDEYFLVVNKPANLPSIPSRNEEDASLLEIVNTYFHDNNYVTIPHIVTRLDKNTTGLVLIAKHRHIHALFGKTDINKFYLALAKGRVADQVIEANIKREEDSIITRCVAEDGDYAKTQVWLEKYYEKNDASLVKLKLFTGRTHQIRVHMSHLGNPLLGDELYGGNKDLIARQALHCYNLQFKHPITQKELSLKAPLAGDIMMITDTKPRNKIF